MARIVLELSLLFTLHHRQYVLPHRHGSLGICIRGYAVLDFVDCPKSTRIQFAVHPTSHAVRTPESSPS
jgi:hypothetical protein